MKPIDYWPILVKCGDILFAYLKKHLTEEQISSYLSYFNSSDADATNRQSLNFITKEQGHSVAVYNAMIAFWRISNLCEAAEFPSLKDISFEKAFHIVFSTLQAGIVVGSTASEEQIQSLQLLAQHGRKFALSVGKREDELTAYLRKLCRSFHETHGRYPRTKQVMAILEKECGKGFIHTVNDEGTVEWGNGNGSTRLKSIEKRLTKIRKNST